jgi:hypothetical protein
MVFGRSEKSVILIMTKMALEKAEKSVILKNGTNGRRKNGKNW